MRRMFDAPPMTRRGNRYRLAPENKECPQCHGAPPLVVKDGRHVPEYCPTCEGRGSVPRESTDTSERG
jgi:DnaJ-class molecular chaperone